ncbi:MBL fold metallo-hydrolase [Anaerocolumna xylanovorans]|uniref:L-ascorbate metabolism protein UlaG, beta-lactamase superfamily n=1 Tax=Anaerocolumna xylanovorans DSM 12503 TaxID=1121345 RepID=A0A1M7Y6W1_9FIRM|nr:MBL fold metallo-hydrolase [Anaerocolumna xylanovorans]SHO48387.1 L-ascorbate metabolism protein UlaG, beta-lactamase superfamily [Anaerocolumna xylanovorans DSM 12503]
MKIKWYGQACFRITAENGTRIVMDPYHDMFGYKLPELEAGIVTTSHEHGDHNNVGAISGTFEHIKEAGKFLNAGIEIKGIETFHDKVLGAKRGKNIVYHFKIDGLNVCHCGDLGHLLDCRQMQEIGKVDILLLPVGGTFTLNAADAAKVMKQLSPKIVIPMHYRTKALGKAGIVFEKAEKFVKIAKLNVSMEKELDVSLQDVDKKAGIVILDYK